MQFSDTNSISFTQSFFQSFHFRPLKNDPNKQKHWGVNTEGALRNTLQTKKPLKCLPSKPAPIKLATLAVLVCPQLIDSWFKMLQTLLKEFETPDIVDYLG